MTGTQLRGEPRCRAVVTLDDTAYRCIVDLPHATHYAPHTPIGPVYWAEDEGEL